MFPLPSRLEGFPVTLMEGRGSRFSSRLLSDLPSGIPELLIPGETGYRVPIGDFTGFRLGAGGTQSRPRSPGQRMSAAVRQLVAGKFDIRRNAVRFALRAIWGTAAAGWLSPALRQQVGQAMAAECFRPNRTINFGSGYTLALLRENLDRCHW